MDRFEIPEGKRGAELSAFLVDKLDEVIDGAFSTDLDAVNEFIELWSSNLNLHEYSINNIILAWTQYPELSMLAGFKKWTKLGRTVRKGQKSLKILAPIARKSKDSETGEDIYIVKGFKYVNVFDVNQTEGDNLDFGHPEMIKGDIAFDKIKQISPLPVVVKYAGTSNANVNKERILVAPKDNEAQMVSSLLHEIAHYKLGHVGSDLDKAIKEIEAEAVSYIVTKYLGLQNDKSKYYIRSWSLGAEELRGRGKKVVSTAESIIREIENLS
ncbi:ArdC family protein [uncultured Methanobacterium sp.]|jgi:antirestriction protein ArdC|uniref:ArdC family protein n=1 Tax=uncultured Methanobacterium sp. TaxID=176306 RepID=UPI002805B265|nr:ArdC family protein [uncultured Methanobacterium sp.]